MKVNQFEELKDIAIQKGITITAIDTFYDTTDKIYYKDGTFVENLIPVGNGYQAATFTKSIKYLEVSKGLSNESIVNTIIGINEINNRLQHLQS